MNWLRRRGLLFELAMVLSLVVAVGCGSNSPASKQTAAKTKSGGKSKSGGQTQAAPQPPPKPKITVPQNAYANAPAALQSLTASLSANNADGFQKAEAWLVMNQDSAAPLFAETLNQAEATVETKIAVCRVFPKLGAAAEVPLIAATKNPQPNVRLKALEGLSHIKPSSKQIVATLQAAMHETDRLTRQTAVQGIARIGPPAVDTVPDLLAILNNVKEEETLRSFAKDALKKVDPRKGLMGVAEKAEPQGK